MFIRFGSYGTIYYTFSTESDGTQDRFYIGLHNMNKAMESNAADLQWFPGEKLDPAVAGSVQINVSSGEYCMTIRLDAIADILVLEDTACSNTFRSIREIDCYDRSKN